MPTNDEETRRLLREYIEQEKENEDKGYTLKNVLLVQQEILVNQKEHKSALVQQAMRLDRHGQEIRNIKNALRDKDIYDDGLGDMDTGQYHIKEMQRFIHDAQEKARLEEQARRDSMTWWKRSTITWMVGGIGALMLAAITGATGYILATWAKK